MNGRVEANDLDILGVDDLAPERQHAVLGSTISTRAAKAWNAAGLARIGLHEARHTFASYLIASGLSAKAVTVLIGHSSIATTFDRYGHLFPGHEHEARGLLDAYL